MEITTAMVKELREETRAGVLDCRKALEAHNGDFAAAAAHLKEKGLAAVAERADRATLEGVVEVYGHPGDRIGVMLEMNCETDFVARTDEYKALAHDLALHIAFAAPTYISREQVPPELVASTQAEFREQALEEGKPENILDRIVEGKMDKFYRDICLLEQPFVKDEEKAVGDVLEDNTAKLGEKVVLRRFVRFELGEDL